MSGSRRVYQSTLDVGSPGMAEWELDAFNDQQREKQFCEQCDHSVGADPHFFGFGGFLTGPFCCDSCAFQWLDEQSGD